MALQIHQFPCLSDNYAFLVRDEASGKVASIDTPDAGAILAEADALGWRIDMILNTHWHPDHAGGNAKIKARFGSVVVAPEEVRQLSEIDQVVTHGDSVWLGDTRFDVIDTGGHTLGHVCFHAPSEATVFVGDTLFPMGCGRLFEGTPDQMWASLSRLVRLPDATLVYSAHEYTLANARFAVSVDTSESVAQRVAAVELARANDRPTVPTTIGEEKATNPFLRAPLLVQSVSDVEAFAQIRQRKDVF
ncbi:Hydroxyacylglutathione hydrolase [Sphingobium herbicidovorans NBRC 16415]|uniref:Hydroxyacylglutathione hydrolase n=1 Tax=Sphingobium herbicidovorans (strain ATCC 700291 / DSM 11019 / CCUG 56400 / KCTC 2939 / LMG 18315 / NBRC 16415 / MH) TaxID=1219045 RepID=A0A086PC03_SPHHM|nr:hydroxyacylglutathione hydrolase [Sphingobium herbicidovorans]KFG90921.1 Hydroxyacylglutathione hydrolase [Sphingobium herbicidovorans NBRC 16415]